MHLVFDVKLFFFRFVFVDRFNFNVQWSFIIIFMHNGIHCIHAFQYFVSYGLLNHFWGKSFESFKYVAQFFIQLNLWGISKFLNWMTFVHNLTFYYFIEMPSLQANVVKWLILFEGNVNQLTSLWWLIEKWVVRSAIINEFL